MKVTQNSLLRLHCNTEGLWQFLFQQLSIMDLTQDVRISLMGIYLHFRHYWSESVMSDFKEMPKIFYYAKISLHRSDGIW